MARLKTNRQARFVACAAFLLVGISHAGAQTPREAITALPGFKVERIHTVHAEKEGSWVAMTIDDKGRMITADQYGGLYRFDLPALNEARVGAVEKLDTLGVGGAQGLLYAHGSLYVMVNQRTENKFGEGKSGLHRLRDTNGDDKFDRAELLREMDGMGEHGPHDLMLGPDGRSIYYVNGNNTKVPANLEKHVPVGWAEDLLAPRMWPPVGNGRGILAPAGYVGRTDPDGRVHELLGIGMRNSYRMAFDPNGEIFTYDSDTENEVGMPWYLPTRINHIVSGADHGWRSGSGRWPAYFPDSLPALIDMGPGSPSGLRVGTGAKFPAKYQHALFAADWTYGTLYAIHLVPDGASFHAVKEEFIWGTPLPLTDILINPKDGVFYFIVGGRRNDSALYRVTYTGRESTAPAQYPAPTATARLRRQLEALHAEDLDPARTIAEAWPHLGHADRYVRWAARVALERQPSRLWAEKALAETHPQASIEALVALTRMGDRALQPRIIDSLNRQNISRLSPEMQLQFLRNWQLIITRMGEPTPAVKQRLVAVLEPLFPNENVAVSRELINMLVFLESPAVVAKAVPLLEVSEGVRADAPGDALIERNEVYGARIGAINATRPDRQQIAYAFALRSARLGWTPTLRETYFAWFNEAYKWRGGLSLNGFINNTRLIALAAVPDGADRDRLTKISLRPAPEMPAVTAMPKGPGRNYSVEEAISLVGGQLTGRDFRQGQAMFAATACILCHRLGATGQGTAGPVLTQAASRYTERDLLESIINPSASVNENNASTLYELRDGTTIVGQPAFEERGELFVAANPMQPNDLTLVRVRDIRESRPYEKSVMPGGLINSLNAEELRDLMAYILSGGNASHPMFSRQTN